MNVYPEYVSVIDENNDIHKVLYKDIKEHEEFIIEDNIGYGLMHSEYSQKDIETYRNQAYNELKELKQRIRENPDVILKLDTTSERYIVVK